MKVIDSRKACCGQDIFKSRSLTAVTTVVIHRINVGETAEEVARFFDDPQWHTGEKMPYHFIVRRDGEVEYSVPVEWIALGGGSSNQYGIQIGVVGDFRTKEPTSVQLKALISLCTLLCKMLGKVTIVAHDQVPGGSSDPKKKCPGQFLSVELIKNYVRAKLSDDIVTELCQAGIEIS